MSSLHIPKTLILLPCHSIWKFYTATNRDSPGTDENEWSLLSFQIESQDQLIFIEHLKKSILLIDEEDSVLVISGGATKNDTGPVTEAQSYYYLGLQLGLINEINKGKIVLENFARDSMENLMFSIMRFQHIYGEIPQRVIVVGFEFKRHRFIQNHAKFLQIDEDKVEYIGFNPVLINEDEQVNAKFLQTTESLEYKHAVQHFEVDPIGIRKQLMGKKLSRDPFHNGAESNYASQCEGIILEQLVIDDELLRYYTKDEIEANLHICKIYKFITNHL